MDKASQVDISKALATPGWMSERELTWLANKSRDCEVIVEFGSYLGRSTTAMADNAPDNSVIFAVDPWSGKYSTDDGKELMDVNTYVMPFFAENLSNHIRNHRVIPVRGYSYNFKLGMLADMVFIDGDHRYETVVKDIHRALSLLKSNGLICGHDYNHPIWFGVKKAVDEILGSVEVEDTIWHARKS